MIKNYNLENTRNYSRILKQFEKIWTTWKTLLICWKLWFCWNFELNLVETITRGCFRNWSYNLFVFGSYLLVPIRLMRWFHVLVSTLRLTMVPNRLVLYRREDASVFFLLTQSARKKCLGFDPPILILVVFVVFVS